MDRLRRCGMLTALAGALMASALSCSSTVVLEPMASQHHAGAHEQAYEELVSRSDRFIERQGPLVYALDAGMLAHYARMWEDSNRHLAEAELRIAANYTESISADVASYLVNDNTRSYRGEDYEDLYANVFKSLNYLHLGDPEGAMVELRRFSEKQELLKSKYDLLMDDLREAGDVDSASYGLSGGGPVSLRFSTSALGNWLQMVLARDTGDVSQAQFSTRQVKEAFAKQPGLYPFPIPQTVEEDLRTPPEGFVRIDFVSFSGLAPVKEEVIQRVRLASGDWIKIALPRMVVRPSRVASVEVYLSDGTRFRLDPIEDIGAVATDTFRLNLRYIETKTVLRAMLKTTGTTAIDIAAASFASEAESEEEADSIRFYGTLLSFASRVFNEASESADVRVSHFYPDLAWAGGMFVNPGVYDAEVVYRDSGGRVIYRQRIEGMDAGSGRVNLWEGVCPL